MRALLTAVAAAVIAGACSASIASAARAGPVRLGAQGVAVGAAGWHALAFEPITAREVAVVGLSRRARIHHVDADRDVIVVGGTLTALSTISLL